MFPDFDPGFVIVNKDFIAAITGANLSISMDLRNKFLTRCFRLYDQDTFCVRLNFKPLTYSETHNPHNMSA